MPARTPSSIAQENLHSIPAKWGNAVALRVAQICHVLTVGLLGAIGLVMNLGLGVFDRRGHCRRVVDL